MEFKEFEKLISETASQNNVDKDSILKDLADIIKLKYGYSIMEKERDLINEVKNKVITKLYNSEDQKINADADIHKKFKLDVLENDYLNSALDELQAEGLALVTKANVSLTKEGVMKFKQFYGEI